MRRALITALLAVAVAVPAHAQTFPTNDPVIRAMWAEGMGPGSQAYPLAQVLMDSIGPRLTNTPGHVSSMDWLLKLYSSWGVPARKESYGTFRAWRQSSGRSLEFGGL